MMEYTLVFRRPVTSAVTSRAAARQWLAVRPPLAFARGPRAAQTPSDSNVALSQVFVVPIYSALGLDSLAYDRFLAESGAITAALRLLSRTTVDRPAQAEIARKEIQSLVMAAEVQHIVDQLSA